MIAETTALRDFAGPLAAKADERISKLMGYPTEPINDWLTALLAGKHCEVGWRESCGTTDRTAKVAAEWRKLVKAMRNRGAEIEEQPVAHGNAWATKAGGFWRSVVYALTEVRQ